jgi:hypothetical protein
MNVRVKMNINNYKVCELVHVNIDTSMDLFMFMFMFTYLLFWI